MGLSHTMYHTLDDIRAQWPDQQVSILKITTQNRSASEPLKRTLPLHSLLLHHVQLILLCMCDQI